MSPLSAMEARDGLNVVVDADHQRRTGSCTEPSSG
jgi:hypothetical protein